MGVLSVLYGEGISFARIGTRVCHSLFGIEGCIAGIHLGFGIKWMVCRRWFELMLNGHLNSACSIWLHGGHHYLSFDKIRYCSY